MIKNLTDEQILVEVNQLRDHLFRTLSKEPRKGMELLDELCDTWDENAIRYCMQHMETDGYLKVGRPENFWVNLTTTGMKYANGSSPS